tara:strand:+ start:2110 stop:3312 length:1203 start_codon:yes stop_codon:yes gene_type:complete
MSFTSNSDAEGLTPRSPAYVGPLLSDIGKQAASADASRSIDSALIASIKKNDVMRLSASPEISGLDETFVNIGSELQAVAGQCTSTAWCLWNHLCTFHHFAGLLGKQNTDLLSDVVSKHEWVCFPAGAESKVSGWQTDSGNFELNGVASFGSGSRYADWAGVVFKEGASQKPMFAFANLRSPGIEIEKTWQAMSLRASATDHIHYTNAHVPSKSVVHLPYKYREHLRNPSTEMIHHRYREDWVAISVMWLGAMATGLVEAAFHEAIESIRHRVAIVGTKMSDKPTIHINLGKVRALLNAASDTVYSALDETDNRSAMKIIPTENDYFRQCASGMQAVQFCDEALKIILRTLGGNGLREGTNFERRYRDFQAMPLHINGHVDRITEQLGRLSLGMKTQNPF